MAEAEALALQWKFFTAFDFEVYPLLTLWKLTSPLITCAQMFTSSVTLFPFLPNDKCLCSSWTNRKKKNVEVMAKNKVNFEVNKIGAA